MKIPAIENRSQFTVDAAAHILKRFYFLQREIVLMQAAWLPGTACLEIKLALAEALWQDALIAGQLRQRVLELRYPERRIEIDEDAPFIGAIRRIQDAPEGSGFFRALHEILKPFVGKLFESYLQVADPLDDSPTVRILAQAQQDIVQQSRRAREILAADGSTGSWLEEAQQWIRGLDALSLASRKETAAPSGDGPLRGGKPFEIARRAARDPRFARPVFAWPDRLNPVLGAGEGLELQVRAAVHHLNEIWAAEMAAAVLYDLSNEAPPEFLEDAARWCFDESRHCRMGYARLFEFGYQPTEIPVDSFSYDAGASLDPLARLGIIYYFETTYIRTKSERTKIFAEFGDRASSHDMDYDWADELIHTYYGNKWLKFFLENRQDARTPKDIKRAAEQAVESIRAQATTEDRADTEKHYEEILAKGRSLAAAGTNNATACLPFAGSHSAISATVSDEWLRTLEEISRKPLALCEDFPRIAQRFEAWWNHDVLERPILIGATNAHPSRPLTRRLELLNDPDAWFEAKILDLQQTHRIGDALPHVRLDFGAGMLGALLGGETEIGNDTTWTHAFLDDEWSNAPGWAIKEDHPWWSLLGRLMDRVSEDARGRHLVCTPTMGGPLDILLNFRGSTALCMDAVDQPEKILSASEAAFPAYAAAQSRLYRGIVGQRAGLLHWHLLWSDQPYTVAECDFSFMLGPEQYRDICMPDIIRQSSLFKRAIFHLDGPGSARHIDALLEIPTIHAIQFTPGEGTPSALPWISMFRKIQNAGRSLLIFSPAGEVLELCDALKPEGLAFLLPNPPPVAVLDDLWEQFQRKFR